MPTYQYRCARCGEQFEAWQSIHDDALTVHDGECGGALTKVLAVGGIVLKGPGFYRNDSRTKSDGRERERKGEGDSAKPDAAKSDTSKSDTSKSDTSSGNGSGDSKKSDRGSKSETTTPGASKSDSSKS
ncbi:MAG: FmdB family zinc ribbon protein [Acidimicrobiia bacterium]